MDDADAIASASGTGGLKLKGAGIVVKKSKKDKKKDKKKKDKKRERSSEEPGSSSGGLLPVSQATMTAAEAKFLEKRRKQEAVRIEKNASKSHREKVAEFNAALAKLSEHHDIPKVGPG